jgi:hypothetical protein
MGESQAFKSVISHYNATKDGADVGDKMAREYITCRVMCQ